jgi:hypothetical protein
VFSGYGRRERSQSRSSLVGTSSGLHSDEMQTSAVDRWVELFAADPRARLLASDEAPARWVTLAELHGLGEGHPEVRIARDAAVASPMVTGLVGALPTWGCDEAVSGHESPAYLPNMLAFVADLGLRAGDDDRVDQALDLLCAHQDEDGRFLSFGRAPGHHERRWSSLPCDTHLITDVLVRYGRAEHPAVHRGLERISADLQATNQGRAWTCIPDPVVRWRGPGRKGDVCPQVTLEALRAFSRLPDAHRPPHLLDAAKTLLNVWRNRGGHLPYQFGHGSRFKAVKWPPLWYGAYATLDTLGRYPALWRDGSDADRRSLAELVACLVAYNVAPDGTVTPRSVYRGFAGYSFGQKKAPSPTATALLAAVVRRFGDLTDAIVDVDVTKLGSSKGGSGTPVAPKAN